MRRNTIVTATLATITIAIMLIPLDGHAADRGHPVLINTDGSSWWEYKLVWDEGSLDNWSYTGACITNATVTGAAASEGWVVWTETATFVIFTQGGYMTSGDTQTFRIEGNCGQGLGSWTCEESSGTIDGSLPVTLNRFDAMFDHGTMTLRWRTESEVNNLGFNVYRSDANDGKFVKMNKKLIPGQGNKAMPTEYHFVDKTATTGAVYYYCLEDIDVEGIRHKSDVVQSRSVVSRAMTWGRLKQQR